MLKEAYSICFSVTCFSESLRCMIHPKGDERKFKIAAKATPKKSVSKAGHTLEEALTIAPAVKALLADKQDKEAVQESIVRGVMADWRTKAGVGMLVFLDWTISNSIIVIAHYM